MVIFTVASEDVGISDRRRQKLPDTFQTELNIHHWHTEQLKGKKKNQKYLISNSQAAPQRDLKLSVTQKLVPTLFCSKSHRRIYKENFKFHGKNSRKPQLNELVSRPLGEACLLTVVILKMHALVTHITVRAVFMALRLKNSK